MTLSALERAKRQQEEAANTLQRWVRGHISRARFRHMMGRALPRRQRRKRREDVMKRPVMAYLASSRSDRAMGDNLKRLLSEEELTTVSSEMRRWQGKPGPTENWL